MARSSREIDAPAPPLCPDPEVLAAWVDQGLEAAERARVDTHLAGCDDCRLLVARVIEFQQAMAEETAAQPGAASVAVEPSREAGRPATVLSFTRRVTRWRVAALAIAAAALLLAVQMRPMWGPGGGSGADSRLADLADAVGQMRTVEARLTGGFRYGPLRAPLRSGGSAAPMDNWTLYAAAGRIREVAQQDPSAPNLHGLGMAHLVVGNYDEAVQALEDAIAEAPQNARYQSDLAAAYLARAKQADRPDDVPRALAAAERAIAIEDLLEARFNRALALQSLFLEDQARQAWDDYLARDNTSDWAEDARRHLAALQRSANIRNDLARNNSPPPIDDTTVEAGLEWLLRHGLPAWAAAILAHDDNAATTQHTALADYATRIAAASGDAFAVSLTALPPSRDPAAAAHATTVGGFARAMTLVDADNKPEAEKAFAAACASPRAPYASLCELELGTFDVLHKSDTVLARIDRVQVVAQAQSLVYLQIRTAELKAYRAMFKSDYATLLREYEGAYDSARRSKYLVQAGLVAAQLSSFYDVIGRPLDAWRWRSVALKATALPAARSLRYLTAVSAAFSLARESNYEAARAFLVPILSEGETPSRLQQIPALVSQTRAALAVGDMAAATDALDAAWRIVKTSTDLRAGFVKSEVLALEASVAWARRDLQTAERSMAAALAAMGPERAQRRAAALLERTRIRADAGSDLAGAQSDFNEAMLLLQSRGLEGAQPLPADDTRVAFEATAALVEARSDLQDGRGLALTENLRLLLTGVSAGTTTVSTEGLVDTAARLEPTTAAVVFLFGSKGLLSWTLANGGIHFRQLPIERRDVERQVAALTVQLARSPLREDLWKTHLAELFDVLLKDLPGVRSASEVVIVPDGPLRRVPFGSLVDRSSGVFLFERTSVRVVPSLMFGLSAPPVRPVEASLLSIGEPEVTGGANSGFPRLPNARAEAKQVATLYRKATMLIGRDATKGAVLEKLPQSDVLHFAGHATGGGSGVPPRLLLAGAVNDPAATLSVSDLKDRLRGARIVLAACETAAAARADRSVGAVDLAGGFLRAGATSVIATLWKVDDLVGQEFFVGVHRGLAAGQSPAVAVAAAQRACRASVSCRANPVTWVGTTVYGME